MTAVKIEATEVTQVTQGAMGVCLEVLHSLFPSRPLWVLAQWMQNPLYYVDTGELTASITIPIALEGNSRDIFSLRVQMMLLTVFESDRVTIEWNPLSIAGFRDENWIEYTASYEGGKLITHLRYNNFPLQPA